MIAIVSARRFGLWTKLFQQWLKKQLNAVKVFNSGLFTSLREYISGLFTEVSDEQIEQMCDGMMWSDNGMWCPSMEVDENGGAPLSIEVDEDGGAYFVNE